MMVLEVRVRGFQTLLGFVSCKGYEVDYGIEGIITPSPVRTSVTWLELRAFSGFLAEDYWLCAGTQP